MSVRGVAIGRTTEPRARETAEDTSVNNEPTVLHQAYTPTAYAPGPPMCGRLTELASSAAAFLAPNTAALLASAIAAALAAGVIASGVDALSCATFACPAFALRLRPCERDFVAPPPVLPSWVGLAFGW